MAPRFEQRKPNVRDVARQAGVSVATVSRVLNRSPMVSKGTRTQVETAIEALQFVPSSAARAINSGRTRLVGALIPTLDHAIFARFIDAVEEELDAAGLSLIVAKTGDEAERELLKARKLLDIGVEGLIVSGLTRAKGFDALVSRYRVPVVATSYYKADHPYPTIGYDNVAVARSALDHLLALGHRKIAVLSGPSHDNDRTRARIEGLQGREGAELRLIETAITFEAAGVATRKLRAGYPDITALLCLSDVLAQGAILALASDGVRVPDQISVMGIDDLPTSASVNPPLTTVRLPVQRMGQAAAHAIANWIEKDEVPLSTNLQTRLIPRASTKRNSG